MIRVTDFLIVLNVSLLEQYQDQELTSSRDLQ
jgi:hypothetical protein